MKVPERVLPLFRKGDGHIERKKTTHNLSDAWEVCM